MLNLTLTIIGKTISKTSQMLNRGNGSTWPGHIALNVNRHFIRDILSNSGIKTIIIAGTNGKTTTTSLIRAGLEQNGKKVIQNVSGANLLNGIASALLLKTNSVNKLTQDYALFEVDENALPQVLKQIEPDYLILLNLFRDQLDRYGEINTIAEKWKEAITRLPSKTKLVLNADDPQIAYLGQVLTPDYKLRHPVLDLGSKKIDSHFRRNDMQRNILYFGLNDEKSKHKSHQAADSISCPKCGNKLTFEDITFSHLGNWKCAKCGLQRPKKIFTDTPFYPLSGTYSKYNINAAVLVLQDLKINHKEINEALKNFKPSFGRQEIIRYQDRNVQLFLSKNPTSFNQSYQTIKDLHAQTLLVTLNDRIPDGRDISWIWDTDLSELDKFKHVIISGDRVYDMALRIQYAYKEKWKMENDKWTIEPNLEKAIAVGMQKISKNETLFILPTYSAMLDVRKILTGKKIL